MSEQAITTTNTTEVATQPTVQRSDIEGFILGSKLAQDLTPAQRELCIKTAMAWGLNPLKREIHFVAYNGQEPKIVVGYDVYIKRAERTNNLNGWKCWTQGSGSDMVAKIMIHRKDWAQPFEHEVYYDEAVQKNSRGEVNQTWAKMPRFMLKKVAIGQGFRLCFPEEFGGLPYMAEEVGLDEVVNNGYVTREDGQQTNTLTGEIVDAAPQPAPAPRPAQPAAPRTTTQPTRPATPAPLCPKCSGPMWDNRPGKLDGTRNPKSPDFKCKDKDCDGVIWPGESHPKESVATRTAVQESAVIDEDLRQTFPGAVEVEQDETPEPDWDKVGPDEVAAFYAEKEGI